MSQVNTLPGLTQQKSQDGGLFTKQQRLLKPAEFSRVFDKPIRSADKWLTVLARKNNLSYSRLGLAISKKAVKRAVDRNRLKRLTRESFRLHQTELTHCGNGFDIVVMARRGVSLQDNQIILDSLSKHWSRIVSGNQRRRERSKQTPKN